MESSTSSSTLTNLNPRMTIASLKTLIEQDIGILPEMYALTYLDACPLLDDTRLQDNFIVDGGTLVLRSWRLWEDLLQYSYTGDHKLCLQTMSVTGSSEWNRHCAWVALYIASHRGHYLLVAKLLSETKVAINAKSPCGWTPLHATARTGQWKVLCILLDKGADVRLKDNKKLTAFDLARKHGHKKCENSLNFCQWNLQKHYIVQERRKEYDPNKARRMSVRQSHLNHDSTLSTWLHGKQGQIYLTHIQNSVPIKQVEEYNKQQKISHHQPLVPINDTSLSSLKVDSTSRLSETHESDDIISESDDYEGAKFRFNYGWFDSLRAQQLIPPTNDILTYVDPSSCLLRPRSLLNPEGFTTPLVHFPIVQPSKPK